MATNESKQQIIDKIMEQHRRELEACWDASEGEAGEGSGKEIDQFVTGLEDICGSFGRSSLKAFLEDRDERQFAKKKRKPGTS